MDLGKLIHELQVEKDKLDRVIATLEQLQEHDRTELPKSRGRKSVSADERQKISVRMKEYWKNRHKLGSTT